MGSYKIKKNKHIVWLHSARKQELASLGSKAANLAKLIQAGFSVPHGFCITTEAFDYFMSHSKQINRVFLRNAARKELSESMLSTDLPSDLKNEILVSYQHLIKDNPLGLKVAVRSSSPVEDLHGASFAGQYVSILNVANEKELMKAILQCWGSVFSPQVHAYAVATKHDNKHISMAVLVQSMVPAEMGGVLFTIDPLSSDKQHMVTEVSLGSADAVVRGIKTGMCLKAHKESLTIVVPSEFNKSMGRFKTEAFNWTRLLMIGLDIEKFMHSPQDIEWAYCNNTFWILQSRPITTSKQNISRQIWTRANAGEILPGAVTPLTWSIFKPMLTVAGNYLGKSPFTLHWRWQHPDGQFPDSPRLFHGHAYMELSCVYASFGSLPGVTPEILKRVLGFEYHLCLDHEIPNKSSRRHLMDFFRQTFFWSEMLQITNILQNTAKKWMQKDVSKKINRMQRGYVTSEVLLREIDVLLQETSRILALHIQCTSMAFSAFGLLDRLVRKYIQQDELLKFETALIADFQKISTVTQVTAIWNMAQAVRQDSQITKALVAAQSADEFFNSLKICAGAAVFTKLWEAFILHFGERSSQEFELAIPHWDEDYSFVLQTMKEIIDKAIPDPREKMMQRQKLGKDILHRICRQLKGNGSLIESWFLNRLIATYTTWVPLRENLKYCVVSRFNRLRKKYLELGTILANRMLLKDRNDIFFLHNEEIIKLIGNPSESLDETERLVSERKKEHNDHTQTTVADVLMVINGDVIPIESPRGDNANVLQGIGCSYGQCTGPAYVLDSALSNVSIPKGHILVAPSIDPGLTPLFLSACGLVTEIGGILSHGATVAREYGLPAVVGISNATKIIKNGQKITVDGITGKVYLQ